MIMVLFATNVLFGVSYWRARAAVSTVRLASSRVAAERGALLLHLTTHSLVGSGPFLDGFDVKDGKQMVLDSTQDGLYYLMSSSCSICADNYAFLNRLRHDSDYTVVGLAPRDAVTELRSSIGEGRVQFPVVLQPSGRVMQIMPLYGAPLTVVVDSGRVKYFVAGVFDHEQKAVIQAIASRSR